MKRLSYLVIILCLLFCSCHSSWKSPDGYSENEILEIGYNEGYECGKQFGTHMYEGDTYERLKKAAKNEYFGEIITSEDNRVYTKFTKAFFRGMQDGVNGRPNNY